MISCSHRNFDFSISRNTILYIKFLLKFFNSPSAAMANKLYQYSVISALMDGVASGGAELERLREQGTHGLGTFENIEGEMVMIDGVAYHLKADGSIQLASSSIKLPFAMVTRFQPTSTRNTSLAHKDDIMKNAHEMFPKANNLFLALRIEAVFQSIKVRTVRGQSYKGQPLAELGSSQTVNTYKDIRGTVFGFRSPPFSQGISVAGGHLHFVSADRDCGGHVLALEAQDALMSSAVIRHIHIELPESEQFNDAKLEVQTESIGKIEG
jgi:alpha-acetolactate decarboxylase